MLTSSHGENKAWLVSLFYLKRVQIQFHTALECREPNTIPREERLLIATQAVGLKLPA